MYLLCIFIGVRLVSNMFSNIYIINVYATIYVNKSDKTETVRLSGRKRAEFFVEIEITITLRTLKLKQNGTIDLNYKIKLDFIYYWILYWIILVEKLGFRRHISIMLILISNNILCFFMAHEFMAIIGFKL